MTDFERADRGETPITATDVEPRLLTPVCGHGIGDIITSPNSPKLIADVRIESYPVWPDDRGYFLEIGRMTQGMLADLNPETSQISAALSYPGTIKAFHYHLKQIDYWTAPVGMLQVALVDLRKESKTFGQRNTLYLGTLRPWRILIPPGVGHGYKVVGSQAALLVYVTSRTYDPEDEGRLPYNDPGIAYDWELQHK